MQASCFSITQPVKDCRPYIPPCGEIINIAHVLAARPGEGSPANAGRGVLETGEILDIPKRIPPFKGWARKGCVPTPMICSCDGEASLVPANTQKKKKKTLHWRKWQNWRWHKPSALSGVVLCFPSLTYSFHPFPLPQYLFVLQMVVCWSELRQ